MKETITLLDVCRLPDVQIHSKNALFKQIVNKETPEMQKIRDNIVKLSYTTKTIGVKDEEVGIFSKRLPLKFKNSNSKTIIKKEVESSFNPKYIAHKTFFTAPLMTVRKKNEETLEPTLNTHRQENLNVAVNTEYGPPHINNFKPTSKLKARTQSMARLRVYGTSKREQSREKVISKAATRTSSIPMKRNKKSFSGLLKDINSNKETDRVTMMTPLRNEENVLFKRIQKISGANKVLY